MSVDKNLTDLLTKERTMSRSYRFNGEAINTKKIRKNDREWRNTRRSKRTAVATGEFFSLSEPAIQYDVPQLQIVTR